ncbi:MAG: DUF2851 family protein [Candidatus Hydrogenedentes bacterium]|nr:DUF2851 family protein [Candidatus Hydrogenedentota bacterium]
MDTSPFSSAYSAYRITGQCAKENSELMESDLQHCWMKARFPDSLTSVEGHRIRIISPGWWNRQAGPDFQNAQVEFNGQLCTGDVEIHSAAPNWYSHGHQNDPAYNKVILHVLQHPPSENVKPAVTEAGKTIATLVIPAALLHKSSMAEIVPDRCGRCASFLLNHQGSVNGLAYFLDIAGEWRILEKARRFRERAERTDAEQALYELFMEACGYAQFKKLFRIVAESLPYTRARQIAQQNPLALEACFFRLSDLCPESWSYDTEIPKHYSDISTLLKETMPGLKSLNLQWPKNQIRPANVPERRFAGAARFLSRTAERGLHKNLDLIWRQQNTPLERRQAMERLFGKATGFWANHFKWDGEPMQKATAPLGMGRIRAIIGNVFIPAAIASASGEEKETDSLLRKNIHNFFIALPKEPENRIHRRMIEWLNLKTNALKLNFRRQQGLMQIYEDWCAHNPSCDNCSIMAYMQSLSDI